MRRGDFSKPSTWFIALLLISLLIATASRAQEDLPCWTKLASTITPHQYHAAAAAEGRVYVVGGAGLPAFEEFGGLAVVDAPDGFVDSCQRLRNQSRWSCDYDVVDAYDVRTGTWERRANMSAPRNRLAAVAAGDRIYAIGGFDGQRNLPVVEEYDPAKNLWERKADMPTARHGHSAVAVDGKILVIGGYGP